MASRIATIAKQIVPSLPKSMVKGVNEEKKKKVKVPADDDEFIDIAALMRKPSSEETKGTPEVSATSSIIPSTKLTLKALRSSPILLAGLTTDAMLAFKPFLFPAGRIFKLNVGWLETITVNSSSQFGGSSSGGSFTVVDFTNAAEWSSLSTLFDAVYLQKALCHYHPRNLYRANVPATAISNTGMAWCDIHHGNGLYTSISSMLSNPTVQISQTNDLKFRHTWNNIDKVTKDSIDITKSGTAIPTQGWCSTNATAIAAYTGQVQYIASSLLTDWTSATIADVTVQFALWFRNRA